MFTHRTVEIKVQEGMGFVQANDSQEYSVTNQNGMVFSAHCRYGTTYAKDGQTALEDCKRMIDDRFSTIV